MQPSVAAHLDAAFQQERRFLKFRFGAQAVLAVSFALILGPMIAAIWLGICIAYGFAAVTWLDGPGRRRLSRPAWIIASLAHISVGVAVNGSMAVVAALQAGTWGLLNGELLLVCLVLNTATMARASRTAFFAAIIPIIALMLALALIAFQGEPSAAGLSCILIGMVLLLANAVAVHQWSMEAAIQIERAKDAAVAATNAKSIFIAMVSHELRTPLSGILAGSDQLRASAPEAAGRAQAGLIHDSGLMMRTLLNDLLDVSKLEAGRMDVEQITFDLRKVLRDTVMFWRPEARKVNVRLRLTGARPAPRWAVGDPTRIRQILNNLLSNALKFTEAGSVTLEVAWAPQAAMGDLVVAVRDTGPGMKTCQLERLFRPFEQLSTNTARTHGGTGLGLTISRQLARAMSGDLTVQSLPGVGSRFELALPLVLAREDRISTNPEQNNRANDLVILVADDHPVNREAARLMLGALVKEIVCVEDGIEALSVLAKRPFDLVILDIHMPKLGGLETIRALRAQPGPNRLTPAMALTGAATDQDIALYLTAGFASVAAKPIQVREIVEAMHQAFGTASELKAQNLIHGDCNALVEMR